MITVKHVADGGNETIHAGTHVSWHVRQDSDDPRETALTLHNRDGIVETFRESGVAYVVNESGKTVGVYRLPTLNPNNARRESWDQIKARARKSVASGIAEHKG